MDYAGFEELIDGLGTGEKNSALEVRTILRHFLETIHQPGDIKPIYCTAEDLVNDYDSTGLGLGKRAGWARCNGLNGTITIEGKTIIGHGDTYPTVGAPVGSNNIILTKNNLPELDATFPVSDADNGGGSKVYVMATDVEASGTKTYSNSVNKTSPNTAISVMQSSVVLVYLQKL